MSHRMGLLITSLASLALSGAELLGAECAARSGAAGQIGTTVVLPGSGNPYAGHGYESVYQGSAMSLSSPFVNYGAVAAGDAIRAQAQANHVEAMRKRILRNAVTDAQRLAAADQAHQQGDVRVASMIYVQIALARPPNESSQAARQRLAQLAVEAREKLNQIDAELEGESDLSTPRKVVLESPSDEEVSQRILPWETPVATAFRRYEEIASEYQHVKEVKSEMRKHIAQQRSRPEYASILNEPLAKSLWQAGQDHEVRKEMCCAYWAYENAAELAPAPSASRARDRLERLEQDPTIVAAAETCRELRRCHDKYNVAIRLVNVNPIRARELFKEIIQRAPDDSKVYRAAYAQIGSAK